jgi:hypothetical protein
MVNIKALEVIETVFFGISLATLLTASQIWLYSFGYKRGYGIGKHCGMTEGLYKAKQRENSRLTHKKTSDKMREWANSTTNPQTVSVSSLSTTR